MDTIDDPPESVASGDAGGGPSTTPGRPDDGGAEPQPRLEDVDRDLLDRAWALGELDLADRPEAIEELDSAIVAELRRIEDL